MFYQIVRIILEFCNFVTAHREQDEEYINRRKILMAKVEKLRPTKTRKVVGSQIARRRNYSTLLNSTKVWRERCKKQDVDAKEPRRSQYIKDVPHLYVFSRRKNIFTYIFISTFYENTVCSFVLRWRNKESTEIKDVLTFS